VEQGKARLFSLGVVRCASGVSENVVKIESAIFFTGLKKVLDFLK